ncbi:MAG TPA: chromosome segregation protein SMC [Tepidisphaeraceae bacterium]|nr:chromosome segregation protein SMC [Tepidisphaeraceae bacterium]
MRLKKLILHGFKSFADRTEFSFDVPITGIVGPNGCGKSNVVDGFKWVLGEQSAKSLRGDAMLDVIFNGSDSRKPAAMAEVTMVFENPRNDQGLRSLNLDLDEVSVGRRLYRDGTSEYQVNNQTARLKDVRELFLDTGVGVDAYSVIEQGRVAALLEANPEERRVIFEEAAGISKFKQRKKETQRKLEKVDQNLLRVNDIVEEVDKRLRSVKVQAGRARTFQEYSARLSELRLGYALQEYHTHKTALGEIEGRRDDAQFRLDDAGGDLARTQNELALKRQNQEALSQTRQRLEYELVQANAAMQSARQRQQYARQQLEQIAEQLATFDQDKQSLETKRVQVAESLAAEQENLARLTEEMNAQRQLIDQRQQAFRDGQLRLNAASQQIEQGKARILDLLRQLASINSRLGAIEIERKNIAAQQTRIGDRRRMVVEELARLENDRASLQSKLDEANATIADQQGQLESRRAEAVALGRQIAQVGEQLGAAKEHRSGLLSRQKLLQDLEARREGVSEGVKSVLRQREAKFPFVRGLVADVLRVDVEHAHVIEAALDGRDQLLVTESGAAASAAAPVMAELEGRVNLLCVDHLPAYENGYDWNAHPHRIRLASDLVRFDAADAAVALHLLGKTVIVDDLAVAADLRQNGPRGYRYVTTVGEVLESDGTLRAGPLTAAMGILSRRSELQALAQQVAEVDGRIAQLSRRLTDDNTLARSLEEQIGALRNAIYASNTAKVEATSALAQNADRQNALKREQPILDRELQMLMESAGRLADEQSRLSEKQKAFDAEQSVRQQEVESLAEEQKRISEDLRAWGEQLTAARVQLGQTQEKQIASSQSVQRQTGAKSELDEQIQRLIQSAKSVAGRRGGVEHELASATSAEEMLRSTAAAHESRLAEITGELAAATELVQSLTSDVNLLREKVQEIERELHEAQLKAGEEKVRLESLVQRTLDELQLDLPARYADLTAEGKAYDPGQTDWEAIGAEIRELREKIHRLGNVNVEAIGEQSELEGRQQFLAAQIADLSNSRQQLQALIEEINQESSLRFEQTFNAVREHFQVMFRKLFGGGKADIFLETPAEPAPAAPAAEGASAEVEAAPAAPKVDILDAGIEIIARPPGKQPVSISQLSGGEKTMTCVAMLLSIFKSKPSPFCILDEVDAALDEANNERFNSIVQEFLAQSQFIIITHSKRTMAIASTLYGVTMQEQGVSKRVSVKLEQVDHQGRIAESAAA